LKLLFYVLLSALLLLFAYYIFRILVRQEYKARGRLSPLTSGLQLLVFLGYFLFPYVYNPPAWASFWMKTSMQPPGLFLPGLVLTCLGMALAFGVMAWFGFGIAFGVNIEGLRKIGPYRVSRNPQVLGGYLMVLGISLQWPSLYALGWIGMYALIMHWMVLAEEEHLSRIFGEEYVMYCQKVPRYLWIRKRPENNSPAG
jgi:protein-S-isoprenylcysteine O-methyltransferase Ste14